MNTKCNKLTYRKQKKVCTGNTPLTVIFLLNFSTFDFTGQNRLMWSCMKYNLTNFNGKKTTKNRINRWKVSFSVLNVSRTCFCPGFYCLPRRCSLRHYNNVRMKNYAKLGDDVTWRQPMATFLIEESATPRVRRRSRFSPRGKLSAVQLEESTSKLSFLIFRPGPVNNPHRETR